MKKLAALLIVLALTTSAHAQIIFSHSASTGGGPPALPALVHCTTNYLLAAGNALSTTIPATAAGNCLAIGMGNYHSHATSFKTNGVAATLQITTNAFIGSSGTLTYGEGYILANCGANITSLEVDTTTDNAGGGNPGGYITVEIQEWSGLSTTPYTPTERLAQNGVQNVATITAGQINNATAVSVYFAVCVSDDAGQITGINGSGTDGTFTEVPNTRNPGVATEFSMVYQIVNTSAARQHVWTRQNTVHSTAVAAWVLHQ